MEDANALRTTTLTASVEGQLAEVARSLDRLADDLDGRHTVRADEVDGVTERVVAATDAIRFVAIVTGPA